jgi:putative nucleotidyltransferase with HDIG domain
MPPQIPFRLQPRPWGRLRERATPKALAPNEARRVAPFIGLTFLAGALALWKLSLASPEVTASAIILAGTLVALGLGAEVLSYNQTKDQAGSAAAIPFAAAVLVAPHAYTVVFILVAETIAQALHRRAAVKAAFNLAQHALAHSLGVLALLAAGGQSFLLLEGLSFVDSLRELLVPSVILVAVVKLANTTCVSGAVALSSEKTFFRIWAVAMRWSLPQIFVTLVVTFYLTWLSVNLGILGTAGMAIPIILVRQLHRTTVELTTVTEELLELMVAAIEARDTYTSGHSRRVAKASEIIARSIGLNQAEVERVTVAALLHDVGKIDEKFGPILAKEGRLTPEEWEIMKHHPIRGAELVGLLSSLRDIVPAIRHHHENWDGTGYPDGLSSDQIPLASRIIMFADTLDAITTDRPYRKALGIEEARAEFIRFRGQQFDPNICDRVVSGSVWAELYVCFGSDARRSQRIA